jgi:hypothetical protein
VWGGKGQGKLFLEPTGFSGVPQSFHKNVTSEWGLAPQNAGLGEARPSGLLASLSTPTAREARPRPAQEGSRLATTMAETRTREGWAHFLALLVIVI